MNSLVKDCQYRVCGMVDGCALTESLRGSIGVCAYEVDQTCSEIEGLIEQERREMCQEGDLYIQEAMRLL
jgi:hypothetical protein